MNDDGDPEMPIRRTPLTPHYLPKPGSTAVTKHEKVVQIDRNQLYYVVLDGSLVL